MQGWPAALAGPLGINVRGYAQALTAQPWREHLTGYGAQVACKARLHPPQTCTGWRLAAEGKGEVPARDQATGAGPGPRPAHSIYPGQAALDGPDTTVQLKLHANNGAEGKPKPKSKLNVNRQQIAEAGAPEGEVAVTSQVHLAP